MTPVLIGLIVGVGIALGWCAEYCLEALNDWVRRRR